MLKVLSLRVKNLLQAPPRVKMCPKEANNVTKGWGLRLSSHNLPRSNWDLRFEALAHPLWIRVTVGAEELLIS